MGNWGQFPGFHPGLFSDRPSGTNDAVANESPRMRKLRNSRRSIDSAALRKNRLRRVRGSPGLQLQETLRGRSGQALGHRGVVPGACEKQIPFGNDNKKSKNNRRSFVTLQENSSLGWVRGTGNQAETGSWYPTQATKTKTSLGWGTIGLCLGHAKSRFPSGMTTRKARTTADPSLAIQRVTGTQEHKSRGWARGIPP
jgi:hypothetical protein